jgi:branched-chain amino acid transport system ATP-binding protein
MGAIQEEIEVRHDFQGALVSAPAYAVELRDLRKSFGKTEIIRGTNLAVAPGERVAIIGPNGAGKSTLFNLISGRFGPTSGQVLLNGKRIDGLLPYEINRLGLARSFQITNIFGRLSVFENLRCGLLWAMGYRYAFWKFLADLRDANERAEQLLSMLRLERKRDTLAMNLTYAEQRALEIGITIAGGAEVVLLDEPTSGMSKSETGRFIELIRDVTVGKTLLTVEHDWASCRPCRQDRRPRLRRSDRFRRSGEGPRQRARPGGLSRLGAGGTADGASRRAGLTPCCS